MVRADKGYLWKSRDNSGTWTRETIKILPNGFGHGSPDGVPLNVGAFQPGITLQFGTRKGRLLMAGRILGPSDGGKSWPVKRRVHPGPSAYSNLGAGRTGTPSEGKILLHYEGGEKHCYEGVYVAVFNLSWLLNGRDLRDVLPQ